MLLVRPSTYDSFHVVNKYGSHNISLWNAIINYSHTIINHFHNFFILLLDVLYIKCI